MGGNEDLFHERVTMLGLERTLAPGETIRRISLGDTVAAQVDGDSLGSRLFTNRRCREQIGCADGRFKRHGLSIPLVLSSAFVASLLR